MRVDRKLRACLIPPGGPVIEAGVVEDLAVRVQRKLPLALLKVALQAEPVTVPGGKRLALLEAELASVPVRNQQMPRQRIPHQELRDTPVLMGRRAASQVVNIPVSRSKGEKSLTEYIGLMP